MIAILGNVRVCPATGHTDMRRGFNMHPLALARSPFPNHLSQIEKVVERGAADSPRTGSSPTSDSGAS